MIGRSGWTTEIGDNIEDAPVEEVNVLPYSVPPNRIAVDGTSVGVALLVTGEISRFAVPSDEGERAPTTVIASGFEGPHTIMLRPDATLWISEHFAGRIVALTIDQP